MLQKLWQWWAEIFSSGCDLPRRYPCICVLSSWVIHDVKDYSGMSGFFAGHGRGQIMGDRRKISLLIVVVAICPLFIFAASQWTEALHLTIQTIGICIIAVSIIGRTWCSFFIGGRKSYKLINVGPYAIIRNPLYAFSFIGAIGMGAQFGAVSFAMLSGAGVALVLYRRSLREERGMLALHGDAYRKYMAQVPRFLPRTWTWQLVTLGATRSAAVVRTFVDACLFLMAIPVAEFVHHLQQVGILKVLVLLP